MWRWGKGGRTVAGGSEWGKKKGLVCVVDMLDVKGEGVSRQCVCACLCVYLKRTISWGQLRRIQNEPSLNNNKKKVINYCSHSSSHTVQEESLSVCMTTLNWLAAVRLGRLQPASLGVRTQHAAKMAAVVRWRHVASRQHVGTCYCYSRTSCSAKVPATAATAGG